jgi:hypothetical protein
MRFVKLVDVVAKVIDVEENNIKITRKYVEVGSTDSVLVSSLRGEGEKSLFLDRNSSSFHITSPSVDLTVAQKTISNQRANRCGLLQPHEKAICCTGFVISC